MYNREGEDTSHYLSRSSVHLLQPYVIYRFTQFYKFPHHTLRAHRTQNSFEFNNRILQKHLVFYKNIFTEESPSLTSLVNYCQQFSFNIGVLAFPWKEIEIDNFCVFRQSPSRSKLWYAKDIPVYQNGWSATIRILKWFWPRHGCNASWGNEKM